RSNGEAQVRWRLLAQTLPQPAHDCLFELRELEGPGARGSRDVQCSIACDARRPGVCGHARSDGLRPSGHKLAQSHLGTEAGELSAHFVSDRARKGFHAARACPGRTSTTRSGVTMPGRSVAVTTV